MRHPVRRKNPSEFNANCLLSFLFQRPKNEAGDDRNAFALCEESTKFAFQIADDFCCRRCCSRCRQRAVAGCDWLRFIWWCGISFDERANGRKKFAPALLINERQILSEFLITLPSLHGSDDFLFSSECLSSANCFIYDFMDAINSISLLCSFARRRPGQSKHKNKTENSLALFALPRRIHVHIE